jgi:hypothetical protein
MRHTAIRGFSYSPDKEIAGDLSALLTLFTRRLIVVAAKVRESYPGQQGSGFPEFPVPIRDAVFSHWPQRPATVIATPELVGDEWRVRHEVRSHTPHPVPIKPETLNDFFVKIASRPDNLAARILASARRYQNAMRFIPQDIDLAYQLLISAIETLSNFALPGFEPPLARWKESRRDLVAHLEGLGLPAPEIDNIVSLVTKPMTLESRTIRQIYRGKSRR